MYAINGRFNRTFRDFELYRQLGIVSVTTTRFKENLMKMKPGERFALYSSGNGWLGVGRVVEPAVPFGEFEMRQGGRLIEYDQYPFKEIGRINPHFAKEEYVMRVEWLGLVSSLEEAIDFGTFDSKDPVVLLDETQKDAVMDVFNVRK
ncbi:hypothetical protein FO441_01760 [Salinicoccus cyprini]|uniref:EVE domain-containing protein n=1 Tax=Salinicoccus cyprini TaxID=2493691 RepID=A0A558AXP4_9STAP|nr:hypothetical protein [Salinicoccus cyprini]TVT29028.1 hypothetical protein FO441_01760 [Salinicoccus cyprini]